MFLIRWACRTLLGLHLLMVVVVWATAALKIEAEPVQAFRKHLVGVYERVGFGNAVTGIVVIGVVLLLPLFVPMLLPSGRRKAKEDD